jgi:hypothetical protein
MTDTSIGSPLFFRSPGFRIAFPGFDPAKPFENSYQLGGVPEIKHAASTIYVRFPGNWSPDLDQTKTNITAVLSLSIFDENHILLKSQDVIFSKAVWSWSGRGGKGEFGLWVHNPGHNGSETGFTFDPAKTYTLRVIYTPGMVPPSTTNIYLTIENGGRI